MKYWNFPAVAGGQVNSINNAGIETFRGDEINSLGRETLQNSIDAAYDDKKPVIVNFSGFQLKTTDFPGYDEFLNVINHCEATWEGNNPKSEQFIAQAKKILTSPTISFIRISDFNTKGLEGAFSDKLGTPWSSLIREAGSSNKGDSSGGSFGIGKSAPAANSKLRTLFYDTLDIKGDSSHIGVANIMSYKKDDKITTGVGYFTKDEYSGAIPGLLSLDPNFKRSEPGTDIYISAFNPNDDWKELLIQSVLMNFFITIHQQKLIVQIEDVEINNKNIGELIMALDDRDEFTTLKSYYQLLVSDDTLVIPSPEREYKTIGKFEEGEATLLLTTGEDLNRRVLMTRKTGMRLFERGHISGSISFTGILMITGKNMNPIFKELENPTHTKWEPNRYEKNPRAAEKAIKDLFKFVRDTVHKKFQTKETESMDAIGLSDLLPDELATGEGKKKKESLTINIKGVNQKQKSKVKRKPKKTKDNDDIDGLLEDAGVEDEDTGNPNPDVNPNPNPEPNPNPTPGPNSDPDSDNAPTQKVKKEKNIPIGATMNYLCTDKTNGVYKVRLQSDKKFTKGKLEFFITGEQREVKLPIISASSAQAENISIDNNIIRFTNKFKDKNINLQLTIDYDDYCSLEVNLYEV